MGTVGVHPKVKEATMTNYPYFAPVPQPKADFSTGACREYEVDVFFPGRGDMHGIRRAIKICKTCSISEACLDFALESNEPYGIWGGMTGKQRRAEKRRRAALKVTAEAL